ncbi:hypothetical protein [Paracraurococcus ruber]|uniref:Uncharacterized protein n=1 Tax=Paracraurococcus ruber TaxID=77675 RepID=A0ABS1D3Z8_9PROT|nr:hypothetical protein [Paracraurococcus ruber]MBK1661276.1 hypothetical protein [Paracraurococcus ruber]TDG23900.1 hypothetical protein E2C05_26290 [Paracraurococcus ruber]
MPDAPAPFLLFLLLCLLASGLAALGAARRLGWRRALAFGGIVLAGEAVAFAGLAALGLPFAVCALPALLFGLPFTLRQRRPEDESARLAAARWQPLASPPRI